jgi:hypothetical protein
MAERRDITVNVRLSRSEVTALEGWAEKEQRTRSDMARILLGEAFAMRATIDARLGRTGRPRKVTEKETKP